MTTNDGTWDDGYTDGKSDGRAERDDELRPALEAVVELMPRQRWQDSEDAHDWKQIATDMSDAAKRVL